MSLTIHGIDKSRSWKAPRTPAQHAESSPSVVSTLVFLHFFCRAKEAFSNSQAPTLRSAHASSLRRVRTPGASTQGAQHLEGAYRNFPRISWAASPVTAIVSRRGHMSLPGGVLDRLEHDLESWRPAGTKWIGRGLVHLGDMHICGLRHSPRTGCLLSQQMSANMQSALRLSNVRSMKASATCRPI